MFCKTPLPDEWGPQSRRECARQCPPAAVGSCVDQTPRVWSVPVSGDQTQRRHSAMLDTVVYSHCTLHVIETDVSFFINN